MATGRPPRDYGVSAGDVFGRLTFLREVRGAPTKTQRLGPRCAECRCVCGKRVTVNLHGLVSGHTESCGCLHRERSSAAAKRDGLSVTGRERMAAVGRANRTHGTSATYLYQLWVLVKKRCEKPSQARYADYGGRGIRLCERWQDVTVFITDVESEIGPRPPGYTKSGKRPYWTLDRVDVNGNYEPGNIRWASYAEQRANQRRMPRL